MRAQPPLTVVGATDIDTRSGIRIRGADLLSAIKRQSTRRLPAVFNRHCHHLTHLAVLCCLGPSTALGSHFLEICLWTSFKGFWFSGMMVVQPILSPATLALFDNSTTCLSHCVGSWILDSGASDHVVANPSLISNLSPPNIPHSITLANGSKAQVTGIGQASPLPSLSLNYVLFVPGCPFNLISISKLTDSLNCSITFSSKSFCIQDCNTGKTIGTGSVSQGLYYLHSQSSTICGVSASPDMIHRRLGHPSLDKLKVLVPQLSHLKSLDCESCQLGKHVRASFPSSPNKRSKSPFDIVHSDVWGPSRGS